MASLISLEDKNLEKSSIVTGRFRTYSDIDLSFAVKGDGDVYKKLDAAAVKQSVKNIVLTNYYEKPFLPKFGGNVRDLLFELADENTEFEIENAIISSIEKYEPRVNVLSVAAESRPDNNSLAVTILFKVVNTEEEITFTTVLSRLR